ncbi:MAG TPA: DUF1579 domain-containing protein [Phycisphaerales bacterium]|nr:DUF1579 domain-containing protein [Phycisphaerales bacterium]
MIKRTITIVAASAALLAGGWMSAGEPGQPGEMGMPDMSAMIEMMKKAAEPGDMHAMLAKMAGDWKITSKFWMQPGGDPEVSRGVCRNKMVLGGRQLLTEVDIDMKFMGQQMEFSGLGMLGYDKFSKKFQSVWCDTMGTAQMIQTGTLNEDGNIEIKGTSKNMMGEMTVRNVYKFVDGGFDLEFWESGPMTGGQEFQTGVIEFRK